MTNILPLVSLVSVATLLAATLYQGNPDRNNKLWNIASERANFRGFFQNKILINDDGEGNVFIIFFYEISHFRNLVNNFF